MKGKKELQPDKVIYTPPEVSYFGSQQARWMQENKHRSLEFFIPGMQDYVLPLLPYESMLINGQTSNFKSGFIYAWEFAAAKQFQAQGRDEVIVHVSVEDSIEEQAYLMLGIESEFTASQIARGQIQDWDRLEEAAVRVGTIPIYRIGHSIARKEVIADLHVTNMLKALWYMKNKMKKKLGAVFFDYLQAFPFDDEVKTARLKDQRRLQVEQDFLRIHRAASYLECPIIVAVQARENLKSPVKIPSKWEIHETTDPARHASRSIQIALPHDNFPVGHWLEYGPFNFEVEENHLFVQVGKQRGRMKHGKTWLCWIDFDKNKISTCTTQSLNAPNSAFQGQTTKTVV